MQNKPHYTANIGDRIRKYRLFRNMTQKQLADECMLSESAIRNYELGNRIPDEKTIRDIADILEIDNALLRDIDPEDISSMERLFYDMEAIYGIVPQFIDGELHIIFKRPDKNSSNRDIINHYYLEDQLLDWCAVYDALQDGRITAEEYETWKIAHSDIEGTDFKIETYHLSLEEQILVESCRRAEGLMPAPVFDSNKNLLDIPKRKKDKPSPEEASDSASAKKPKRKRKPKINK
jgi:transcriptional regulator with XRE-family HTH domain